jgi:hypothetical protein
LFSSGDGIRRARAAPIAVMCSKGYISVREWRFPSCQSINGQDEKAALNIQAVGASTVRLGDVRQAMPAIAV